jgi:hypothetical protein
MPIAAGPTPLLNNRHLTEPLGFSLYTTYNHLRNFHKARGYGQHRAFACDEHD